MSIKLSWDDQSSQALDAIEIYRSTNAKIDSTNPGTPLATLAGTDVTYTDTTAIIGVFYYYRIAAVKGGKRSWSVNYPAAHHVNPGPGPASILRGTWEYGYFGDVDAGSLLDRAGLLGLIPELNTTNTPNVWTKWAKFACRGKILYSPQVINPLLISYTALNNAGLLFGTDVAEDLPSWAAGGVNHKRVIAVGERNYIFRMLKMSNGLPSDYVTTYAQSQLGEARLSWAPHVRFDTIDANAKTTAVPRIGEGTTAFSAVLSQNLSSATNTSKLTGLEAMDSSVALATATPTTFVLELVP